MLAKISLGAATILQFVEENPNSVRGLLGFTISTILQ